MAPTNTLAQLTQQWEDLASSGSLLTQKHDPNFAFHPSAATRSVISHQLSASLEAFIASRNYTVDEYYNTQHKNGYYTVIPDASYNNFVAGYSAISGSQATAYLDSIILVSGSSQGWHIFAESSTRINQRVTAGDLVHQGQVK